MLLFLTKENKYSRQPEWQTFGFGQKLLIKVASNVTPKLKQLNGILSFYCLNFSYSYESKNHTNMITLFMKELIQRLKL